MKNLIECDRKPENTANEKVVNVPVNNEIVCFINWSHISVVDRFSVLYIFNNLEQSNHNNKADKIKSAKTDAINQ